jgi:hypothetical protein
MKIPEYVTVDEVKRVCKELGIRDWTALAVPEVPAEEAGIILAELDLGGLEVEPEEFRKGLEVELEHGVMFKNANVTNNHPLLTGMIVLAHMYEMLDYYMRLEVAEIEGDIFKALKTGNKEKLEKYQKKLITARAELSAHENKNK